MIAYTSNCLMSPGWLASIAECDSIIHATFLTLLSLVVLRMASPGVTAMKWEGDGLQWSLGPTTADYCCSFGYGKHTSGQVV